MHGGHTTCLNYLFSYLLSDGFGFLSSAFLFLLLGFLFGLDSDTLSFLFCLTFNISFLLCLTMFCLFYLFPSLYLFHCFSGFS